MRITIDLPTVEIDPADDGSRTPDSAPRGLPDCPHCGHEQAGHMARTTDGLVHDWCVRGWLTRADERAAWRALAREIAQRPSRQSASAVRAVITAMLAMQPRASHLPDAQ